MKTVDTMRMMIALGLLIVSVAAVGQQTPAPPQSQSILIEGATAHLGTGDVIESCAIGLKDGRIDYVGRSFQVNKDEYDVVIDGRGQHVYPGFIVLNTTLGLQEIGAVRATQDQYEVGTFRPNVRSVIAFNTDSEILRRSVPTAS